MIRSIALWLAALLTLSPALAQAPADVRVALDTAAGRIVIAVHADKAPVTAANFLA